MVWQSWSISLVGGFITGEMICWIPKARAEDTWRTFLFTLYFLAQLCLHKCGGVYLRCQDQCWPWINNFLGTCTLAAYRLGYINLSHPPLHLVSIRLLTPSIHFSLTVKLIVLIFSWALLDTLFVWLSIWGLLLPFHCVVSLSNSRSHIGERTQLQPSSLQSTLPVIWAAVNIFWTSSFPGWHV